MKARSCPARHCGTVSLPDRYASGMILISCTFCRSGPS